MNRRSPESKLVYAVAGLLVALPIVAQQPGCGFGPGPPAAFGFVGATASVSDYTFDVPMHGSGQFVAAPLPDLSRAQHERIGALMDAQQPRLRTLMLDMADHGKRLDAAMRADALDEAEVRKAAQARAQTEVELTVLRARLHHDIQAVLTPEQRQRQPRPFTIPLPPPPPPGAR
jgi:Spy/CpxP family protein refolding chaperone